MLSLALNLVLAVTIVVCTGVHTLKYSDLTAVGAGCPTRDRCRGETNNSLSSDYMNRSCECDYKCGAYKDCCIDAMSAALPKNNVQCLHYGQYAHTGVFVVSKCRHDWNGPIEIQQKCVAPLNMTDPMLSAPVTDTSGSITYRNVFCAECNYAEMASLSRFSLGIQCDGLPDNLTDDQIMDEMTYNNDMGMWGMYRNDGFETHFHICDIDFDVPGYLNNSVRFCRSNLISACAPDWTRHEVRRKCESYTAVVYDSMVAYRNPHCVICNHKIVNNTSCNWNILSRGKKPMSFALLLDVNQSDGDQVGMRRVATPECPSGHKYDPFFKKCRQLVCALPGFVVRDGRCVRG